MKGENRWYLAPRALLEIFKDNQWQHFAFGPFVVKSEKVGRTYLHSVQNGAIVARPQQIKDWELWKDAVAQKPNGFRVFMIRIFTTNPKGLKIEAMITGVSSREAVNLVRRDGVTFKDVPISRFSDSGQLLVRKWRESQDQ